MGRSFIFHVKQSRYAVGVVLYVRSARALHRSRSMISAAGRSGALLAALAAIRRSSSQCRRDGSQEAKWGIQRGRGSSETACSISAFVIT